MAPKLLLFDLDDTLWPCRPTIARAERILHAWLCERLPALCDEHDIDSLRRLRQDFMRRHPELTHDLTRVRLESLRELCRDYHADSAIAEQGTRMFRHERNRVTPYPDVIPVLTALREKHVLASLTNGNADVEQTPLRGLFHVNITSMAVGVAKPHAAMFTAAGKATGIAPAHTMMIGDDIQRDIEPAAALGMRTALIQRETDNDPATHADLIASDLTELAAWLKPSGVRTP